ncbi:MAG: putative toxin-antitoxin system toxin component, PIN family [Bacteroidetes bacterium CG02_land_8_20_14_3_00_31_25]|jgi:putative PIN family toxin of toxin-antitoxin system|nr:putative toxin-antitoxin system toxin component, PIN family [Bacteroidota bacterium]NCQ56172.1 putative toxin-antitoxin system toxin component, PIN family [Candidatus Parcubacteria bacterium]PIV57630.1 MAG: putative toxin-antitoxin system toxin component, PIN family [Bacteroidetes bacterium CG02_land_8_20_14_3_00_31_25]PIX36014.1 MAG: putative toxin-antitoxin system toxin component, PIN family [Bacteroidetes bacterium CG_4_8_14_3_um_filter_31_14]
MKRTNRLVFDTNVVVSAFLFPDSYVAKAFEKGLKSGTIFISEETLEELQEVLLRDKFDKYLPKPIRQAFVQKFEILVAMIDITETIIACRDPKDDKFLSLAVSANAEYIVSGDHDLLVLNPFRNILILSPFEFLK